MNATETKDAVAAILTQAQVSFAVTYSGETTRPDSGKGWKRDAWNVRIASGKAFLETSYYTGLGLRSKAKNRFLQDRPQKPAAADVLHSLTLDAQANDMSFQDWCGDFGYSDDSIEAFDTYRACCKIATQLRAVFKPETLADIRAALQDY